MSSQYGKLRRTSGWDRSGSLGHPGNFNGFRVLASLLTAATSLNGSQTNFARCLAVSWAGTLHIHCPGFLSRYGILPGAKFTLHPPSLALSYFGSVTARHLRSGLEPNFVALNRARHLHSAGRPYVNSCSRSLYAIACPSVCLLCVTFARPTQAVQIFGNISTALGTLAFCSIKKVFWMF